MKNDQICFKCTWKYSLTNTQTADCFTAAFNLLWTSAASYTSNKTKITIMLNTGQQPGDEKRAFTLTISLKSELGKPFSFFMQDTYENAYA